MVDPHERSFVVLDAHGNVDEAVSKTADAKLEFEAALESAEKAERIANDI